MSHWAACMCVCWLVWQTHVWSAVWTLGLHTGFNTETRGCQWLLYLTETALGGDYTGGLIVCACAIGKGGLNSCGQKMDRGRYQIQLGRWMDWWWPFLYLNPFLFISLFFLCLSCGVQISFSVSFSFSWQISLIMQTFFTQVFAKVWDHMKESSLKVEIKKRQILKTSETYFIWC